MAARSVSVTLTADVSGFTAAMGRAAASVDQVDAKTRESSQSIARSARDNSQEWNTVGTTLTRVGAMAAAGLGLSAKAAMDWESAFAGVKKTVDQSSPAFAGLEGELRQMARTMATSHTEIAATAEAAGQLGVATEDVASFTRTMIMLGETTNMTADQAATSLAQFMTIMGTAPDQVGNLGAALVGLGNNSATTESQILQMSQRIAGAGKAIGLTEADVMGFAAAIASTGVEVEAGGTAISMTMLKMEQAVRAGGRELDLLASTAGMSAAEFKTAFETDAAGAINAFVEGLGRVGASGGDVTAILRDLGITGIREADTLRRLANAGTLLGDSLKLAGDEMASGTALIAEYAQRAATTESQVRIAWNNIKDAAISAGAAMLPAIRSASSALADFAAWMGNLGPGAQAFAVGSLAVVAAVGLIGGAVIKAVVGLAELAAALKAIGALSAISAGMSALAGGLAAAARQAAPLAIALAAVAVTARALNQALKEGDAGYQMTRNLQNMEQAVLGVTKASSNAPSFDEIFTFETGLVIKERLDGLDSAMREINKTGAMASFEQWSHDMGMATSLAGEAKERFLELDNAMAGLTKNGQMQAAAAGFDQIAASARSQSVSTEQLIALFPAYSEAVRNAGEAIKGQNLTADELVELMSGRIPASMKEAAAANSDLANELAEVTGAFEQATMSVQDYANQFLALSGAEIAVEQAIANVNEALKENGRNIDLTTEKGRENVSALNALGQASMQRIQTLADQGVAEAEQARQMERARAEYVRVAQAMGYNEAEARKMADAMFATVAPNQQAAAAARNFAIEAAAGSEAAAKLAGALRALPDDTWVQLRVDGAEPAALAVGDLDAELAKLPVDQQVRITLANGEVFVGTAAEAQAALAAIEREVSTDINADPSGAIAGSKTAQSSVDGVTGTEVPVDVDPSGAVRGSATAQGAIDGTRGVTRDINVTSNAAATAAAAQARMDAVRDVHRSIYIKTVQSTVGVSRTDRFGGIPRDADGGLISPYSGPVPAAFAGAQQLSVGGTVAGWSPHPRADNVPIWATAGEVMMSNWAGDRYGRDRLLAINSGRIDPRAFSAFMSAQGFADGGLLRPQRPATQAYAAAPVGSMGVVHNTNITVNNPVARSWAESVRQESALAAVDR